MFASSDDVNMHLPKDKLEVNDPELNLYSVDAERIIRGYLAGTIDRTVMALWTDPQATPEVIKAIAGRFIAAFYYKERYSEDSLEIPQYAQDKYNEAMTMLQGIISGAIEIIELPENVSEGEYFTSADFFPNDTDKGPMFSVDDDLFTIPPTGGR